MTPNEIHSARVEASRLRAAIIELESELLSKFGDSLIGAVDENGSVRCLNCNDFAASESVFEFERGLFDYELTCGICGDALAREEDSE